MYNYNNPLNRVCDYTKALEALGENVVANTGYYSLSSLRARYDSLPDTMGKDAKYAALAKVLPKVHNRNSPKRPWTDKEDAFLVRTLCAYVDPNARSGRFTMTRALGHIGAIIGRTHGACQNRASFLGLTKDSSQYATITTQGGAVLSTKTGKYIGDCFSDKEELQKKAEAIAATPHPFDLTKKPKKNRKVVSQSGRSVINLGKNVRNVSISYTDAGEMQITFEG